MKLTETENRVLAKIDQYLAAIEEPPPAICVYSKQYDSVVSARQKRKRAMDTTEYLNFSSYKGIRIAIYEEQNNVY
jgi:hypothetical protein